MNTSGSLGPRSQRLRPKGVYWWHTGYTLLNLLRDLRAHRGCWVDGWSGSGPLPGRDGGQSISSAGPEHLFSAEPYFLRSGAPSPACSDVFFPQGFLKLRFRTASAELTVLYLGGTSLGGLGVCLLHSPAAAWLSAFCSALSGPGASFPPGSQAGELGPRGSGVEAGVSVVMLGDRRSGPDVGMGGFPPQHHHPPPLLSHGLGGGVAPKHRCTASSAVRFLSVPARL